MTGEGAPSSCSSRSRILFGDHKVSPRVGDEYQVKLPPSMSKDELVQLMENSVHLGLPIPVMWVLDQCESSQENHFTVNSEDANGKVDTLGPALEEREEIAGDGMEIDLGSPKEKTRNLDYGSQGCVPVPGLSGDTWKDIERDSFLLGLYIFEKNLCLVKKFVGSKGMGELLSYYYGKFYKSSEYNKWFKYWKKRKKRRSFGEEFFKSWRQRELMSRLSSHVSEECKTRLMEASRFFKEAKMSLYVEYVFALKEIVGLELLVQEIAIGKGKRDLMGSRMEHAKTNPPFPSRPEIPRGNSGSSLTVDEIVNFLTGDIRLSKSRSHDLFWDAVWPRLVNKGWRTEEPRNYISLSSKPSWVYLIPGIKKFSRKLVKGTHYFDSVADVLNKVALEPKLLEVEPNTTELSICENEDGTDPRPQSEQGTDGFSSRERHSYLQPRVFQEQMKFTIVDTSLVCGKDMEKVMELRTLPADDHVAISTPPNVSEGVEQNIVGESRNMVQESDIISGMEDNPSFEASGVSNNHSLNSLDPMMSESDKHGDQNQPGMRVEIKFNQTVQSSHPCDVGLTTNKQALTSCDNKGISNNDFKDISYDNVENAIQAEAFSKPSSPNSSECSLVEKSQETWIDLNHPHTPPELSETSQQPELLTPKGTVLINGQRQSTRNRPLTTKALEAYAYGYLSPKKKRKSGESAKPPNRRVRSNTAVLTSCGVSIGDEAALQNKIEKGVDGVFNGSSNMVSAYQK